MTADAHHITAPAPDGAGARDAMQLAMQDGGVQPDQIGYINAHGTSTPHGDAAETAAVKSVFGGQARKLVFGSTKSMTGHLLGAAGALEAAVCALVVQTGIIPPTINSSPQTRPATSTRRRTGRETARGHRALELLRVRRHNVTLAINGPHDDDPALQPIAEKVARNERLTRDDGLVLFKSADLLTIGRLADLANRRRNGDRVYFAAEQHLKPHQCVRAAQHLRLLLVRTHAAGSGATRGASRRSSPKRTPPATTRPANSHIVGGLHPKLRLRYYLDMFRGLKERHPASTSGAHGRRGRAPRAPRAPERT